MILFIYFLGCALTSGKYIGSYRHDKDRSLIDIVISSNTTYNAITDLLGLPSFPSDEPEFEYVDNSTMKIWATIEHIKLLQKVKIQYSIGVDESEITFEEEKAINYMDPTDGSDPDWTKYCGSDCMIARFEDLSKNCKYPTELKDYGKSVRGRRLIALKIGTNVPSKGPVLLGGNIHGDEPVGNQMIQRYAYETCMNPDDTQAKIANSSVVWYLPFFNPDGYEANQRANANGVDLNRNFPVIRTPRAEVETSSYMKFAQDIKPSFSTMYHGGLCAALYPYFDCYDKTIIPQCPPGDVPSTHPRGKDFPVAEDLYAKGMLNGGQRCTTSNCKFNVINDGGYPGTGILADWAAAHNNQVDITVEVDRSKRPSGSQLPHYYKIHKPIIDSYNQLPIV